ncbi:MAG TPA: hypothetical protein VLU95_01765, partial [Candidatus Acidoferrum sp.]|nr:hypothetical protein [Candidatus Acidoferrum sp.]
QSSSCFSYDRSNGTVTYNPLPTSLKEETCWDANAVIVQPSPIHLKNSRQPALNKCITIL